MLFVFLSILITFLNPIFASECGPKALCSDKTTVKVGGSIRTRTEYTDIDHFWFNNIYKIKVPESIQADLYKKNKSLISFIYKSEDSHLVFYKTHIKLSSSEQACTHAANSMNPKWLPIFRISGKKIEFYNCHKKKWVFNRRLVADYSENYHEISIRLANPAKRLSAYNALFTALGFPQYTGVYYGPGRPKRIPKKLDSLIPLQLSFGKKSYKTSSNYIRKLNPLYNPGKPRGRRVHDSNDYICNAAPDIEYIYSGAQLLNPKHDRFKFKVRTRSVLEEPFENIVNITLETTDPVSPLKILKPATEKEKVILSKFKGKRDKYKVLRAETFKAARIEFLNCVKETKNNLSTEFLKKIEHKINLKKTECANRKHPLKKEGCIYQHMSRFYKNCKWKRRVSHSIQKQKAYYPFDPRYKQIVLSTGLRPGPQLTYIKNGNSFFAEISEALILKSGVSLEDLSKEKVVKFIYGKEMAEIKFKILAKRNEFYDPKWQETQNKICERMRISN